MPFVCTDRLCGKETRQPRRCKEEGGTERERERERKGDKSHLFFITHSKGRREGYKETAGKKRERESRAVGRENAERKGGICSREVYPCPARLSLNLQYCWYLERSYK